MAEKEEFLFVLPVEESDELRNITPYCNGCTFWPCDEECINRKKPMTRKEAIERMTKGIVSILSVQPGNEPDPWEMWKDYAEAALNALLEGK